MYIGPTVELIVPSVMFGNVCKLCDQLNSTSAYSSKQNARPDMYFMLRMNSQRPLIADCDCCCEIAVPFHWLKVLRIAT